MTQANRKLVVEKTVEDAAAFAAVAMESLLCETISKRAAAYVALAGGTTPHMLYQRLAGAVLSSAVPWQNVEVFFGDERNVPLDDVESNYGMTQRTLLDHLPIAPSHVHPMRADAGDLEAAAAEYEQTIRGIVPVVGDLPQFDLILLGMGADGHTASLFPGAPALREKQKLVMAYHVPVLGRQRMTFTLPLINAARNVMLLVTGEDKADTVARLLSDKETDQRDLPVSSVRPKDGMLYLILDAAAARKACVK